MPHDSSGNTSATVESSDSRYWSHAALHKAQKSGVSARLHGDLRSGPLREAVLLHERADDAYRRGDPDAERLDRDAAARFAILEDLSRPPSLMIPQRDGDLEDLPGPHEASLEAWVYGGLPIRPDELRERLHPK